MRATFDETRSIRLFELVSDDGVPLPAFTPGAHINVHLDGGLVRQYSLCGDPADAGHYLIAVQRARRSRGGSQAMHERLTAGDRFEIGSPRNHFPLQPRAGHHLLLAGGIGITPLLAMMHHLQRCGASWSLHYYTRSLEAAAFRELLGRAEFAAHVQFHPALTGQALRDQLRQVLAARGDDAHLYLCGPQPFMRLAQALAKPAWPDAAVHVEHFGADPAAAGRPSLPFEVTLASSGRSFRVDADQSIADCLRAQGLAVAVSCEQGVCGTCVADVLEGTPDHRDAFLSDRDHRLGARIALCVSRARSERLVLDL